MKRVVVVMFLLAATLAILSSEVISAQGNSPTASNQSSINSSSIQGNGNGSLQRGQPQNGQPTSNSNIEQQKLDLEYQKLEVERSKARWSAASTIVPLLAALGTLIYSVWSFRKQIKQTATLQKESAIATATLQKESASETARLQNESAKLQFEIKAAEIAFSGKTPEAVRNRASVLKTIFGDRLPENFPPTFDPKTYGGGKESPEEKMFFLELLLKYAGKETEIIKGWEMLFGDTWLDRVKPVILREAKKKLKDTPTDSALQGGSTEISEGIKEPEPSSRTPPTTSDIAKPTTDLQPEKQAPNDLTDTVK
jgi:hypothetical protein